MMSYINPQVLTIESPIGIDRVIQRIQQDLSLDLPWLSKAFGRAWYLSEKDGSGKVIKYPKCYSGNGEYVNVLPNDNMTSQCFFWVKGPEKWDGFNREGGGNHKTRELSIIFWGNMKKINPAKTYIFTEELKKDIEKVLIQADYIQGISGYYDEKAEDVFSPFTLNDVDTQYLMYPYIGCRFDVTIKYFDPLC